MCVGLSEPTIRWFQKQSSLLGLTGAMTVSVLTETSLGLVVETPVGAGLLNTSWSPSLTGVVITNLLPLLPDSKTAVAFRFRAVTGTWSVDDVYVDPYAKR
jgi:Ca2+/H+ antiporter